VAERVHGITFIRFTLNLVAGWRLFHEPVLSLDLEWTC
jgi:hypothetical protein